MKKKKKNLPAQKEAMSSRKPFGHASPSPSVKEMCDQGLTGGEGKG